MNHWKKYREAEVMTANRGKLIVLLYDEVIRSLKKAVDKMEKEEEKEFNLLLLKAQRIIRELILSLNMNAGNIAFNLYSLYLYILRRLGEVATTKDAEVIKEVISLLKPLREAWMKVVEVGENEDHN